MIPIRNTLTNILKTNLSDDIVYVLLSGGVDSQSVLFSSIELSKKVIVISFTREDYESRDFKSARSIAETLKLDFIPVLLPVDLATISEKLLYLKKEFNCKLKTDFECMYPMLFAYDAILSDAKKRNISNINVTSGLGADVYYLLSKKASIHYKDRPDDFRTILYTNHNYSQRSKHEKFCKDNNINHVMPYFTDEVFDLFKNKSRKEVNFPLEKNDVREQYKDDFIEKTVFKHTSFQKGDSKISDLFTPLLETSYNLKNWRSVTGIYNAIANGIITKPLKNDN